MGGATSREQQSAASGQRTADGRRPRTPEPRNPAAGSQQAPIRSSRVKQAAGSSQQVGSGQQAISRWGNPGTPEPLHRRDAEAAAFLSGSGPEPPNLGTPEPWNPRIPNPQSPTPSPQPPTPNPQPPTPNPQPPTPNPQPPTPSLQPICGTGATNYNGSFYPPSRLRRSRQMA
jgi:hypothetical protein